MSYRLGVDVGGTFTDLLLINEETGETYTAKVPLHSRGFLDRRAQRRGADLRGIRCGSAAGASRHAWHDGGHQRRADRQWRAAWAW